MHADPNLASTYLPEQPGMWIDGRYFTAEEMVRHGSPRQFWAKVMLRRAALENNRKRALNLNKNKYLPAGNQLPVPAAMEVPEL